MRPVSNFLIMQLSNSRYQDNDSRPDRLFYRFDGPGSKFFFICQNRPVKIKTNHFYLMLHCRLLRIQLLLFYQSLPNNAIYSPIFDS